MTDFDDVEEWLLAHPNGGVMFMLEDNTVSEPLETVHAMREWIDALPDGAEIVHVHRVREIVHLPADRGAAMDQVDAAIHEWLDGDQ
jgi:hypothetical protein